MIEKQGNNNCVARALSTMRLALGYKEPVPGQYEQGSKSPTWILENAGAWFPQHRIKIFCSRDIADATEISSNCEFCGDYLSNSFDWDAYIVAFSYCDPSTDSDKAHFVIGVPCLYVGMKTSFVLCVELK